MNRLVENEQNRLPMSANTAGLLGDQNLGTMSNAQYAALNTLQNQYIPKVDDATWNKAAPTGLGKTIEQGAIYRDPTTGKGISVNYYAGTKNIAGIGFIDQSGVRTNVSARPQDIVSAMYESGIPMSAFSELAKKSGNAYIINPIEPGFETATPAALRPGITLADIGSGKLANVVASDDWLKFQQNAASSQYQGLLGDTDTSNLAAGRLQDSVSSAVN
jgi:hypothetical protein